MTRLQQIVFAIRGASINRQIDALLCRCSRPYRLDAQPTSQAVPLPTAPVGVASPWLIILALTTAFGAGCVVASEQAVASIDAPAPRFGIATCVYPSAPPGAVGDLLDRE